ncbi:MAG: DUF1700 domain-containing protein [Lachnospiraceae bacterium]|nr:DUF1700 domain-containing protein [Lachnospiraceae bacterium]MBR4060229.1 DUF1700 domain-containing protein [Lachnospiraceae bacterium]
MRKEEYLQKLDQLLYDIPSEDRYEAIQFYSDYLEDAGDQVEEVIRSLGTPEELAKSIQKDLYGNNEAGDYTRVYKDVPGTYRVFFSTGGKFTGERCEDNSRYGSNTKRGKESYEAGRKGKLTPGQWIIFLILCLCAAPVIVPICGAFLSIILAIVVVLVAIAFGAGIAGIALVIAAIAVIVVAIVKVIISPLSSAIMLGGGLLMIGLGLIGIAFTAWIVCKVLPKLFVGLVNLCSGIIHKK